MLDDLKYIHQRDGQDALGIAGKQWQQLLHNFSPLSLSGPISNVVYAGMGGSALAALISKSWPGCTVPFTICRNYHIPAFVSKKTLFIASSYSGNTEETLSALAEAEKSGAKIVVIAGGGNLQKIAARKKYPILFIPAAEQPRFAVLYNLKAVAEILAAAKITTQKYMNGQLKAAAEFLSASTENWEPTVPAEKNPAKKLAMELAGKSPVIYAGPFLAPVAYKWKISFNENAKNVAWWNEFPEFNHNEFIGWSSHPPQKPYSIVELRSSFEDRRIKKRLDLSAKLLSGRWPSPHVVDAKGKTQLQQLVWSTAFGDFVSIYLALINNVNPTPVELVEKFKTQLKN